MTGDHPPEIANKLQALTPGTFCTHRSWGFGQVKEYTAEGMVIIDFDTKKNHRMQAEYVAESVKPIPTEHILVHISEHLDELKQRCADEPLDVIRQIIESMGESATAEKIMDLMVPAVIQEDSWRKWWDATKRAMRKDGHFYVPSKKAEALKMLDAPSDLADKAVEDFRKTKVTKKQSAALQVVIKFWPDIKNKDLGLELVKVANQMIKVAPASQFAEMIDLALTRDLLIEEAGLEPITGEMSVSNLVPRSPDALSNLLDNLANVRQAKLINTLERDRDNWDELFLSLLPKANGRTADTIINAFIEVGRTDDIVAAVDRLLRERNVTCDFLFWFCKNRQEIFQDLFKPGLLMAILSVLEADQLADYRKGTRLYELLIGEQELVTALLQGAPFDDVRDVTRAILLSPVFEQLDKRSFLAKIIKIYPEVQAMIVGGADKKEEAARALGTGRLIVSWPSLRARQAELDDIKNKKIPANIKEIEVALSYGDLKENHEFKAAKETQKVLGRRRAELEEMLMRAEGTDFATVSTAEVNIGTRVSLEPESVGDVTVYNIMGAWDSNPKAGMISYLTPLATALLARKVGETVQLPTEDDGLQKFTIMAIDKADTKALIGE